MGSKFSLRAFGLLLAICLPSWAWCGDADHVVGEDGERIREYVNLIHDRLGFSGVVLAARDGEIIAVVARGSVDNESKAALTSETLFEIASCTKSFTAIAVLKLAENGKLSTSDSIAKHLPNVPEDCQRITIRNLLSHTSGIPGTNTRGAGDDIEKVIPTFLAGGPKQWPGTKYDYWNQGYSLLSEIIARASGRSYTQYIRDEIFDPCGMTQSSFTGDDAPAGATVAIGTSTHGKPRSALEHPYGSYGFQYRGMGGLVTNIHDLWKLDRSLAKREIIDQDSLLLMTNDGLGHYGLGWTIMTDPYGQPAHGHSGSVRGFLADVRRYPSLDGALFVLANQDESLPFAAVRSGVEQILFGEPTNLELPNAPDQTMVDRVTGEYMDEKNRRLVIEATGGLPTLKINWFGPVTSGYLGLDAQGTPYLYLLTSSENGIKIKPDGPLGFSDGNDKSKFVTLLGLNPPLKFSRVNQ